jgi:hypothetical protein
MHTTCHYRCRRSADGRAQHTRQILEQMRIHAENQISAEYSLRLSRHYVYRAKHRGVHNLHMHGARRRRSGGSPGVGCARRPVGTYIYLHAVGASNPVAVPCLAR